MPAGVWPHMLVSLTSPRPCPSASAALKDSRLLSTPTCICHEDDEEAQIKRY